MPNYLFVYHGGKTPETEEDVEKTMADWGAWFENMGENLVEPGNPVSQSYTVFSDRVEDNGGANPVSGYSIVSADSIEAATKIAEGCPMVVDGSGNVEVAEIHQM